MSYPPLIDLRIGFWPVVHFIHPCSLFPINNLSIYAQNFFNCIHIVIGDEWYGIVNGQNPTIFDGVTALSPFNGFWPVILLLFMISEWNFTDMLNSKGYILQRRTVTLTFPVHELSALDLSGKCFWPVVPLLYEISEWNFTDMLTIKGYILWLRTSYHCLSQFCCYLGIINLTK